MRMKILVLTHYYPPEVNAPASRMSEHASVWRDAGHAVTIVTCAPNAPSGTLYSGYRNRLFQDEMIGGIRIIRLWTWIAANEGFLPRIANYISYFLSVMFWVWRLPKSDVIISTSPQFFCGLAGAVARIRARKWILEIRDLWPESVVAVGAMKRGFVIRLIERLECWAYRSADLVVPVTDGFVPHIRARAPDTQITVIKNGVDLAQFTAANTDSSTAFRAQHGLTGKFVAAYVGTHGMAHGLDIILDAAEKLRHRTDIALLLVGDGAERNRILVARDRRGLTNVIMLAQQPKAQMPVIWGASNAAVVVLRRVETFKTVIPSKIFEAMALKCPIILGVEGEAKTIVLEANAGLAITPDDSAELALSIEHIADNPSLMAKFGEDGRAFVEAHFDRTMLAHRYLDRIESLLKDAG